SQLSMSVPRILIPIPYTTLFRSQASCYKVIQCNHQIRLQLSRHILPQWALVSMNMLTLDRLASRLSLSLVQTHQSQQEENQCPVSAIVYHGSIWKRARSVFLRLMRKVYQPP